MTFVRVKGFKIFQDRYEKWRCYHRATKTPIDLEKIKMGSVEFFAECSRISALKQMAPVQRAGTLGALIKAYRGSTEYLSLKPRTRADYAKCFDYLKPIDDTALSLFDPPLIIGIRNEAVKKMGRKWGNYVKTSLSLLFAWGIDNAMATSNPAFRIKSKKRAKDSPDVNLPWSDEHRRVVLENLPMDLMVEIHLMMFVGLDPGDVVKLPKTAIKDGQINTRRQKTGEPVWVPLPKPVIDAIALREAAEAGKGLPDATTFCHTRDGRPRTQSGMDSIWYRLRAKLVKEGKLPVDAVLTLKGLRHTVGTMLAEMGYDDRTIADMLGQKTIQMAQHYSKHADRSRKLTAVVHEFNAEIIRREQKAE